ncbi:hypothetical protein C5960_00715 [Cronobacter sakazakii]|uniref:hypothetical protein n=1 Tax=Cronobacter sakazakii TaxID=28141 RepID=UPI000CFA9345|nr:hypothetical protein [Cronobacter sakazakii]EKS1846587.1 hypothetical protein [Cronobacter muytjensii]ELQ6132326.1 hypothetical protein [Cronobacter dublinensis]ELY2768421.1 hypothetical protein [Cronobacter malonaticus]EKY2100770.1 hypothetical protein [Cronobacter sakazakii]PQZ10944.1 hypothetical protein C5960_00715 [Cronobacter sakazakii]
MNRSIFAVALLASFSALAGPSNTAVLKKSLNDMQPLTIADSKGIITVSLDVASITPEIYDTAIYGVCYPVWLHKENTSYLKHTKEVRILNKFKFMGYSFENPKSTCEKAGAEQPEKSKVTIMANTHLVTNKDSQ